jgi:peptide/nickel transport system substrate-binding protein
MGQHEDLRRLLEAGALTRGQFLVRTAATAAAISPLAWLAGCGGSSPSSVGTGGKPPGRPTGTLRIANPGEPASLDPSLGSDIVDWGLVGRHVYDPLVYFDSSYKELKPALATSWESSDDAREWAFQLRPDVVFHDGEPFDSSAYHASLEYYMRDECVWKTNFPAKKDVRIDDSDPLVVRITSKTPAPDFARNQTSLSVISPKLLKGGSRDVASRPTGTGPFRFVSYKRGSTVAVEANDRYWGDGPYLEQLVYRILPDAGARANALVAGDIDVILKADPRQAQQLEGNSDLKVLSTDGWTSSVLIFMCDHAPTDDIRVRQACAHAIDKRAIVEHVFSNQASVVDGTMPEGVYGHTKPATIYPYDPERARQLLDEAGYANGVSVHIAVPANVFVLGEAAAQAIAGQLSEVGIKATVDVLDVPVFVSDLYGPKQTKRALYTGELGWINGGPFHWGAIVPSVSRLGDAELDRAAEAVKSTPDGDARLAAIQKAEDLLAQKLTLLPIFSPKVTSVTRKNLEGYVPPADGYVPNFTAAYLA